MKRAEKEKKRKKRNELSKFKKKHNVKDKYGMTVIYKNTYILRPCKN